VRASRESLRALMTFSVFSVKCFDFDLRGGNHHKPIRNNLRATPLKPHLRQRLRRRPRQHSPIVRAENSSVTRTLKLTVLSNVSHRTLVVRAQPTERQKRPRSRADQVARPVIRRIRKHLRPAHRNFIRVRNHHRRILLRTAAHASERPGARRHTRARHRHQSSELTAGNARRFAHAHACPSCSRVCSARKIVSRPTTPTMWSPERTGI
jgi:hypothetical protein